MIDADPFPHSRPSRKLREYTRWNELVRFSGQSVIKLARKSISQYVSLSLSQPVSQSVCLSVSHWSVSLSVSKPVSQSFSQSAIQSVSQSVSQLASKSVGQLVSHSREIFTVVPFMKWNMWSTIQKCTKITQWTVSVTTRTKAIQTRNQTNFEIYSQSQLTI